MYLPESVKYIINILQDNGYEAYAVGGCVRDSILGRVPGDWDITTSALPEQTKGLFPKTFDTGIEHGTITVLIEGEGYEVTTYRIDGEYQDSRRPDSVEFTASLEEDLLRRDFTINAMAYNEKDGLVDIFGGMEDLKNKTIRCVGNAMDRFTEDALRILRAVRFSAQLNFDIEADTARAISQLAKNLQHISAERIQVEMVKMLISKNPEKILDAYNLGITKVILPEFDKMIATEQETPHHAYSVGVHSVEAVKVVKDDKVLRLALLLHDVGKPQVKTIDEKGVAHFYGHDQESEKLAKSILKRWKMDNYTIDRVCKLIRYHDYRPELNIKAVRRAVNKIGQDLFLHYLEVRRADTMAQSAYMREDKLRSLDEIRALYQVIEREKHCVTLKDLAINGGDLIKMGVPQGRQIGQILHALLELVLEDNALNTRDYLMTAVKQYL